MKCECGTQYTWATWQRLLLVVEEYTTLENGDVVRTETRRCLCGLRLRRGPDAFLNWRVELDKLREIQARNERRRRLAWS